MRGDCRIGTALCAFCGPQSNVGIYIQTILCSRLASLVIHCTVYGLLHEALSCGAVTVSDFIREAELQF